MRFYYFKDGLIVNKDILDGNEIKSMEKVHGDLLYMKHNDKIVLCYYGEKGGTPTWKMAQKARQFS